MKIIANHSHLMPENSWRQGDVDMLLRHMDFCGIEKSVVFPPFACQVDNDMERANRWALDIVKKHSDRLLPAGTLFPLASNAVELLNTLADEGVKLIKIHPSIDLHDVADSSATDFYACAQEKGMILDYHTGPHATRLSLSKPEKFDSISWDFPDLKLIFEHLGGRTYFEEFMAILYNHRIRRRRQQKKLAVFGGLTSTLCKCPGHKVWHIDDKMFTDLIDIAGSDTLIFGLDFPWNDAKANKQAIQVVIEQDIPEKSKQQILGKNIADLLDVKL